MQDTEQLTVTQIMTEIGWTDRSSLARYLDNAQTRELLGASRASRPTYPKAALPALEALYQAHQEHRSTPKTAPMLISAFIGATPTLVLPDTRISRDNRISQLTEQRTLALPEIDAPAPPVADLVQVMREFLAAVKATIPVPDDRVLSTSQAAEYLGCAQGTVSRFVKPLRRGAYRRSDCLRYIQTGVSVRTTRATQSAVPKLLSAEESAAETRETWLSETKNWLASNQITKAEAELLDRVARSEYDGLADPKALDKFFKIRQRAKMAEKLAQNPHAAEDERAEQEELRQALAETFAENARIAGDVSAADDAGYQRDRAKMQKDTDEWLASGKITLAEKRKIVRLYDSEKPLSLEQKEWMRAVAQRAQAG